MNIGLLCIKEIQRKTPNGKYNDIVSFVRWDAVVVVNVVLFFFKIQNQFKQIKMVSSR